MLTIVARNVCEALPTGLGLLLTHGEREETRAGPCLVAPSPVTTVTRSPAERVLFSPARDANPFFHLAEAMWMLAGRSDSGFLNSYVQDFGERFAEKDGRVHGAYGRRWRGGLGYDQLDAIVERLRADRGTRQCVLQMWDATPTHFGESDICFGHDDLVGAWRDRPCNTHAYVRVRENVLDLTVCCRSNDAVWGAHGANAVHFSVLQEYLAARVGVGVGVLYQLSNNYHVYESHLETLRGRARDASGLALASALIDDRYASSETRALPLFDSPDLIDADVVALLDVVAHRKRGRYANDAMYGVELLLLAHAIRSSDAAESLAMIDEASTLLPDWALACREWIERRRGRRTIRVEGTADVEVRR